MWYPLTRNSPPLGSACGCAVIFSSMLLHFPVFASPAPPGKQSLFTKNTLTKKTVITPQNHHQIKCICIITPLGDGGKKAPPISERCLNYFYFLLLILICIHYQIIKSSNYHISSQFPF